MDASSISVVTAALAGAASAGVLTSVSSAASDAVGGAYHKLKSWLDEHVGSSVVNAAARNDIEATKQLKEHLASVDEVTGTGLVVLAERAIQEIAYLSNRPIAVYQNVSNLQNADQANHPLQIGVFGVGGDLLQPNRTETDKP